MFYTENIISSSKQFRALSSVIYLFSSKSLQLSELYFLHTVLVTKGVLLDSLHQYVIYVGDHPLSEICLMIMMVIILLTVVLV
jgi:hypothetical protein